MKRPVVKRGQANREKSPEEELQDALISNCSLSAQLSVSCSAALAAVLGTGTRRALLCV